VIKEGGYFQAGLCIGGTDELEDLFITAQRLASPVFRDFREQAVINWIPFGGSRAIVCDGNRKVEAIAGCSST
jgi:hypothetical protein